MNTDFGFAYFFRKFKPLVSCITMILRPAKAVLLMQLPLLLTISVIVLVLCRIMLLILWCVADSRLVHFYRTCTLFGIFTQVHPVFVDLDKVYCLVGKNSTLYFHLPDNLPTAESFAHEQYIPLKYWPVY